MLKWALYLFNPRKKDRKSAADLKAKDMCFFCQVDMASVLQFFLVFSMFAKVLFIWDLIVLRLCIFPPCYHFI